MPTKVTTAEFIASWEKHGTALKVSKHLGLGERAVHERRVRLMKEGTLLSTDSHKAVYKGNAPVTDINPIKKSAARVEVSVANGCVIVGSDAHYMPGQITTAHRGFVKLCKDLKPRVVVLNGDIFDGGGISRWPRIGWDKKPSVKEELQACLDRVDEIEKACGLARKIWTLGNHDARFETKLAATSPEYEGVKGFQLKDHFPSWMPAWSCWINDELIIKHRLANGIHAAYNNTMKSGKSICTGHLHAQQITRFSDYNGTRYGVDAGMMSEPYSEAFTDYTEDNPVNWRSGFAVFTFINGKMMPPEVVDVIEEGVIWFRGNRIEV